MHPWAVGVIACSTSSLSRYIAAAVPLLAILKDHVDRIVAFDNILEAHYVRMRQLLPCLNLFLQAKDEVLAELLLVGQICTSSLPLVDHLTGVELTGRLHGRGEVGRSE